MLHVTDCLFFDKLVDGSVRILKLARPPDKWPQTGYYFPEDTVLDVTISAAQWNTLEEALRLSSNEAITLYENQDFQKGQ